MRERLGFLSNSKFRILRFQTHFTRGSVRVLGGKLKDSSVIFLGVLSSFMCTFHLGPYQLDIKILSMGKRPKKRRVEEMSESASCLAINL